MSEIKFELRRRNKQRPEFWSVRYRPESGDILGIEPGQSHSADCLIVPYFKVKNLLSGALNQNDFRVIFNENIGSLDLVDLKAPGIFKKKHTWINWLSAGEYQFDDQSPLRFILFADTGVLRVEVNRVWSTALKEKLEGEKIDDGLPFFITDNEDPHQLFGNEEIKVIDIIERGFWEKRLWAFMDHGLVSKILFHGQNIRINMPPVASNISFIRAKEYSAFSGVLDDQTVLSHKGHGKHISIFVKNGGLWAQSHYSQGSPLDQITGNLKIAIVDSNDLEGFVCWAELPTLMLRQHHPFELLPEWQHDTPPMVLYKANNLDIGVMS